MVSPPYCALSDVKAVLGTSSTADDAWIMALIPQAQAQIDTLVGYSFIQEGTPTQPVTKTFSGSGGSILIVGWVQQLVSVTEVVNAIAVAQNGAYVLSPSTSDITNDCLIGPVMTWPSATAPPGWYLTRQSGLPFVHGHGNYQVSGVFGWSFVPADITRACARLVAHYVKMRDTNYADVLLEQAAVRVRYEKQLPADVLELIEPYRLRLFYSYTP